MRLSNGKVGLTLGLLATLLAAGAAAAPAYACVCNSITFVHTTSSSTPYVMLTNPQIFGPTGNKISYSDFGSTTAQYMYVTITGVTPGWTVTITSASTVTTLSGTAIIAGTFSGSGSFSFTITVTGPATPGSTGQFTISAKPSTSGTSYHEPYGVTNCAPLTVYLKTPPPSHGVPEFPIGLPILMALALPAMLLMRKRLPSYSAA